MQHGLAHRTDAVSMSLHTFIPQDRLRALQRGETLPERCTGTALFADISGFTSLTEELTREWGERRGIEKLTQRVNAVYEELIGEVERHGGTVIGFAGDAITCWFEGSGALSARLAAQAALAMQGAMHLFVGLSLKVGVGSGPARRFVIGNAQSQLIDVLAGATIARVATAETLALPGEVLLDQASAALLQVPKGAFRDAATGERFFVLEPAWAAGWPAVPEATAPLPPPDPEMLRPWVLPFVFERETAGLGLLSTDLRPATALFLRFTGLDYDKNPRAAEELADLISAAQRLLQEHGGVLLELTIGDKGSYLYGNFGAAQIHEDDAARALRTAVALREHFAGSPYTVQIGISSGTLRVGGYGSSTRQSFGAMGDDVNSAARLMGLAQPGEILTSGRVRQAVGKEFSMEARPPMPVKGKAEPMPVFAVLGRNRERAIRLQEPAYSLPMVGREAEVAVLTRKLSVALRGQGQVLGISAEAGMGKSRLLAEGIRLAHRAKLMGFGGACQFDGIQTPYLVWHSIWMALFDIDPEWPLRKQVRAIEAQLREHAPEHPEAWPLLGAALGLEWPDNDFTRGLQPKDRKELLETVLLQCLESNANEAQEDGIGLLLVLEDLHALDPLSADLLVRVARAAAHLPVLMLLSYRPPESEASLALAAQLDALHHFESLSLEGLGAPQCEQIIRAKLAGFFPEKAGAIPPALIQLITTRAQGNPFYVEELLNYLHDRGIDPRQLEALERVDLPVSLHSLVLSRIDQLLLPQQLALKVASVIGRMFHAADLYEYCPTLGGPESVKANLIALDRLGFTPLDPDEPELSYLFRHLVTLEASYASLAFTTRQQLHGQYARYLEARNPDHPELLAQQLAHHYSLADVRDKAVHYLRLAGEQAANRYANDEALNCFERALAWLPAEALQERLDLLMLRESLFDLQSKHEARRLELDQAALLAAQLQDASLRRAQLAMRRAKLAIDTGDYPGAQQNAQSAIQAATGLDASEALKTQTLADALLLEARACFYAGQAVQARPQLDQALELARAHGYARGEYNALAQLGLMHWQFGDYGEAESLLTQALARIEAAGDARRHIDILNNLGVVAKARFKFREAVAFYERAKLSAARMGDRSAQAALLTNMGSTSLLAGDFVPAGEYSAKAAALYAELQEPAQAAPLLNLAEAQRELGLFALAQSGVLQALPLLRSQGAKQYEANALENLGLIELSLGNATQAERYATEALVLARELQARALEASLLQRLAQILIAANRLDEAHEALTAATPLVTDLGAELPQLELQATRAQAALAAGDAAQAQALLRSPQDLLARLAHAPSGATLPLPMWLYALAHRVLVACGSPEAATLLKRARDELRQRSERIADPAVRQSFLNIAEHQSILKG